jgi:hypothetical protein
MVLAWPDDGTLRAMPAGARFATAVVYKGRTGADGRFAIPLDPSLLPTEYVGPRGQVDLQVVAPDAQTQADWFFSAVRAERVKAAGRAGWTTQTALSDDSTAPEQVTLDLGRATADTASDPVAKQVAPDGRTLGAVRRAAGATALTAAPTLAVSPRNAAVFARPLSRTVAGRLSVAALPTEVCQNYELRTIRNRPEVFARVFAWSGAKGIVDLNEDSDHTLGVAVQNGKWSSSGTKKISTSAGATVKNVVDAQALNKVNYRDYGNTCYPTVWRRPLSFYALIPGREFRYAGHLKYRYCTPYGPGPPYGRSGAGTPPTRVGSTLARSTCQPSPVGTPRRRSHGRLPGTRRSAALPGTVGSPRPAWTRVRAEQPPRDRHQQQRSWRALTVMATAVGLATGGCTSGHADGGASITTAATTTSTAPSQVRWDSGEAADTGGFGVRLTVPGPGRPFSIGTLMLCVSGPAPAEVIGVRFAQGSGVTVRRYAVRQVDPDTSHYLGADPGTLGKLRFVPTTGSITQISTRCGAAGPRSELGLEVALAPGRRAGRAQDLRVQYRSLSQRGEVRIPLELQLCQRNAPESFCS